VRNLLKVHERFQGMPYIAYVSPYLHWFAGDVCADCDEQALKTIELGTCTQGCERRRIIKRPVSQTII
jgi:hypothetical protein